MLIGVALLGVVTATIAGWFIERLRRVQETVSAAAATEERTEATLEQVLAELREIRAELRERR
jgi:voltage-gated potassium channel